MLCCKGCEIGVSFLAIYNEKLIDLSVDYDRILRLETHLANSVIEATREQGAFLPTTMHIGSFVFFAVDNSDFKEDTPDGKRTLHATVTAPYINDEKILDTAKCTLVS